MAVFKIISKYVKILGSFLEFFKISKLNLTSKSPEFKNIYVLFCSNIPLIHRPREKPLKKQKNQPVESKNKFYILNQYSFTFYHTIYFYRKQ